MKLHFLNEPLLKFGNDSHICPRFGIDNFEVYDSQDYLFDTKPKDIVLGIIGTQSNYELFDKWIDACSDFIPARESKQPNLFTSFPGFNEHVGFRAKMVYNLPYFRQINDSTIKSIINGVSKTKDIKAGINEAASLYLQHIEFLATNKNPKVIVCIIPDSLWSKVLKVDREELFEGEKLESESEDIFAINFRSYLKAKSMQHKVPIQIIRERSLSINQNSGKSELQDLATRAWNFCTAIYYKAGGVPWKANTNADDKFTCFVGISFYRSLDKKTLQTSLAQVFDEQGKGVILRGSPVEIDKSDRQPHLSQEQAYELLLGAINSYHFAEGVFPKRVVMHKTSKYSDGELSGFVQAIEELHISTFDLVTIFESSIRLYRSRNYPPLRGTILELDDNSYVMYTKGAVKFYHTYPGMYIPQPIEVRMTEINTSPLTICNEILTLSKMNWNRTQFDGRMPITISCARSVGEIMKYLLPDEKPEKRYGFYM